MRWQVRAAVAGQDRGARLYGNGQTEVCQRAAWRGEDAELPGGCVPVCTGSAIGGIYSLNIERISAISICTYGYLGRFHECKGGASRYAAFLGRLLEKGRARLRRDASCWLVSTVPRTCGVRSPGLPRGPPDPEHRAASCGWRGSPHRGGLSPRSPGKPSPSAAACGHRVTLGRHCGRAALTGSEMPG